MKRICFLMATPFTLGGEQRVVSILSNLLVNHGYDVTILCTDINAKVDYDLYGLDRKVSIKYIRGYNNKYVIKLRQFREKLFNENANSGKYKRSLFVQKFINCDLITKFLLIYSINKGKYDIVISLSSFYNTMLAAVSHKIKAKTVGWQHSFSDAYFDYKGRRHFNQDKYTRYMFKKLDRYVVLTKYDKKYLKKKFDYNAVVIGNPKSLNSDVVSDLKHKRFLSLGRFVSVKNYEMLIDIFNIFHKKNKEWELHIVGEGELKEKYLKKIKEYKLEKYIKVVDYIKDVKECYLNSSVYLLPSLYEGFPMVLTEAIEFGLPVISFNIAVAPELIKNGKSGYIVKNYDIEKYAECMNVLASDPKLLRSFSKEARNISLKRSNQMIVEKWIKLFDEL